MRVRLTRRAVTTVVAAVAIAALATSAIGPDPPRLSAATSGDRALAQWVRDALGGPDGYRGVAVALVHDGQIRFSGLGSSGDPAHPTVDKHTRFEIGSVTKALNGMLLTDLAAGDRVRLDQRVGDLVPGTRLAQTGDATLAELASHRSGLPRLPRDPVFLARSVVANFTGGDPYRGVTAQDVLGWAGRAAPSGGADPAYSNFGAAVLGNALATHQEMGYGDLLTRRVLVPLGMTDTTVAVTHAALPEPRARGVSRSGRAQASWLSEGFAPAGTGVWSTAGDLARLAAAALSGHAPGIAAIEPRWEFTDGDRIGLGWITSEINGRTVTWHNGGTGGFRSFVALDVEAGRAVVLLANTTAPVDDAGFELLTGEAP